MVVKCSKIASFKLGDVGAMLFAGLKNEEGMIEEGEQFETRVAQTVNGTMIELIISRPPEKSRVHKGSNLIVP